jgi:parvulin-like peptidyl-prolyl isomerase
VYFTGREVAHLVIRTSKAALPGELAAARERMQAVRADIIAGKLDFTTAVHKHSEATNAGTGGDEGFVRRRGPELEEAILKAAFALKVGEISPIIETSSGLHLITVTDRKPGRPSTVEKSIVEVLECYTEDFRSDLIARLRKEGQIRILLP